jgi:RNA polymerase-binding transcription factor DksA
MDADQARRRLEEERARLLSLRDSHHREHLDESLTESQGELSSFGQHPGDQASETAERAMDQSILASLDEGIAEIDAAFARLEAGRYGICEGTGEPIPDDRLEANPAARYTVEYQQQLERSAAEGRSGT